MRAVRIERFGGPEVLEVAHVPDPVRGDGEVLLEVDAAGIDYADTHQVQDSYLARQNALRAPAAPAPAGEDRRSGPT